MTARDAFARAVAAEPSAPDAWANLGTAAWASADTVRSVVGLAARAAPRAAAPPTCASASSWCTPCRWIVGIRAADSASWRVQCRGAALGVWRGVRRWLALDSQAPRSTRRSLADARAWSPACSRIVGFALGDRDVGAASRRRASHRFAERRSRRSAAISGRRAIIGEVVRVTARQGAWTRVRLDDGREGWMRERARRLARRARGSTGRERLTLDPARPIALRDAAVAHCRSAERGRRPDRRRRSRRAAGVRRQGARRERARRGRDQRRPRRRGRRTHAIRVSDDGCGMARGRRAPRARAARDVQDPSRAGPRRRAQLRLSRRGAGRDLLRVAARDRDGDRRRCRHARPRRRRARCSTRRRSRGDAARPCAVSRLFYNAPARLKFLRGRALRMARDSRRGRHRWRSRARRAPHRHARRQAGADAAAATSLRDRLAALWGASFADAPAGRGRRAAATTHVSGLVERRPTSAPRVGASSSR